jgi:hypothetical protein
MDMSGCNIKKVNGVKNDGAQELHDTLAGTMPSALGAAKVPHKSGVNGRPSTCADVVFDLISWEQRADDKDQRKLVLVIKTREDFKASAVRGRRARHSANRSAG